jgi:hypothetical protein
MGGKLVQLSRGRSFECPLSGPYSTLSHVHNPEYQMLNCVNFTDREPEQEAKYTCSLAYSLSRLKTAYYVQSMHD